MSRETGSEDALGGSESTKEPGLATRRRRLLASSIIVCVGILSAAVAEGDGGAPGPKGKFYVYLFGGHSNVFGWDEDHADLETHPRAWAYRWWKDDKWVPAKEDRNSIFDKGAGGGPAMALLRRLTGIEQWSDIDFGVIQTAAVAATARWKRSAGAGLARYLRGSKLHHDLVTAANENKARVTIAALVLDLGYEESFDDGATKSFDVDLRKTIDELRDSLGMPDLPVFLYKFEAECESCKENPRTPILLSKLKKVASDEDRIAYVDAHLTAADYMNNGVKGPGSHHFAASGHEKVVAEMVRLMREKGWGTPPSQGCAVSGAPGVGANDLAVWISLLLLGLIRLVKR